MGQELATASPEAARVFRQADEILGVGLSALMWKGPEDELRLTHNAQPAILVHSVAALRAAHDRIGHTTLVAGHSLGELSAHVAAGTLSFEEAVRAVRLRGRLMLEAGSARPGTMAAILGLEDEAVDRVCRAVGKGVCVPANFNAAGQVVISGDWDGVAEGMERALEAGAKRVIELNVSGAFHSPLMQPAQRGLEEHLAAVRFADPSFPVVSNVTARPVTRANDARETLIRQITAPVRWAESIATMLQAGIMSFLELGPGTVLCGLNKRNAKGVPCASWAKPTDAVAGSASV